MQSKKKHLNYAGVLCVGSVLLALGGLSDFNGWGQTLFFFSAAVLSGALCFYSIHHSTKTLLDFYSFKSIGITNAEAIAKRRRTTEDVKYEELVKGASSEIILSGSSLNGWFKSSDFIDLFKSRISDGVKVSLLFLDPASTNFIDRARSENDQEFALAQRMIESFERLLLHADELDTLISKGKLSILFSHTEPISVLKFDNKIIWDIYLPSVPNRSSPRLIMETGGEFSDNIENVLKQIRYGTTIDGKRGDSYSVKVQKCSEIRAKLELLKEMI